MWLSACGSRFDVQCLDDPGIGAPLGAPIEVTVGGQTLLAQQRAGRHGPWMDLAEHGAFALNPPAHTLQVLRWPAREADREEFLYGPVLLSALAALGTYALHASAFHLGAADAPLVALIAPSGTGKSTCARVAKALGWRRVSDDVMPLALDATGLPQLLPHYPQLKLPPAQHYPADGQSQLPLAALVQLQRAPATEVVPLDGAQVARLLLTATIASRLYPAAILAAHLRFCSDIAVACSAGRLQGWRLCIAHAPAEVEAATAAALRQLQAAVLA